MLRGLYFFSCIGCIGYRVLLAKAIGACTQWRREPETDSFPLKSLFHFNTVFFFKILRIVL